MNFKEKLKDRYNIIRIILIILMIALSIRLAILTIAQGDYYRHIADNKRLKEIRTTPPRGEIRDRHGRLLAGNKPSFTVQLLKDELNIKDIEKKTDSFLKLIRLLEEDGANYVDDFPIELNVFAYDEEDYLSKEISPMDNVLNLIMDHNLLPSILNAYYIDEGYDEHYKFIIANRAINALKQKGVDIPIDVKLQDGQVLLTYNDSKDIDAWKIQQDLALEDSPITALVKLVKEDKAILRKTVNHSVSRKLVYDILASKGLLGSLKLKDYSISYMEDYLNIKRSLKSMFPQITMESTAKEDFINIFQEKSLKRFLQEPILIEDKEILPGEFLLELNKEKGDNLPISVSVSEDGLSVIYKYTGKEIMSEENLVDMIIRHSRENGVLDEFIVHDDIKSLAQAQLLKDGINPKISISKDIEYVDINNLKNFYKGNNIDEDVSIKDAFKSLKENYGIKKSISDYEARGVMVLYTQLRKQGYKAYEPINIAYGIKDSTVAKIEESMTELPGVNISIEPIRYYPEEKTASHILGYLGKISQPEEIKRYIEEENYSPNEIIGKTGIEESFEDKLRGENGIKRVEIDSVGNTTNVVNEERPVPGDNLYLTIDLKLQKKAEEVLQKTLEKLQVGGTYESPWGDFKFGTNKSKRRPYKNATSGAIVAIDVKTGQVLASASYPSYDPNLFSTGISNSDWLSLFPEQENDILAPRPLYNIATQTSIQPGSVFKMITGLAGLENGMSPETKIRDMGQVDIGPKSFNCLVWTLYRRTHGYENIYEALRDSCNYYFYSLALGKNQKTGESLPTKLSIEDIAETSKKLGLNEKTGIEINIPREASGGVPNPQRKIINTKYILKSYLNNNIEKYFKEDFSYDAAYKEDIIEEIISWLELEEKLSRNEVIRRLESFGIDSERKLPGEREGLADKIKYTYINFAGWNITDTLNVTIGQGENSYTPIQIANYIATIANGGYKHKLTLVDNMKDYKNSHINYAHKVNPQRIQLNDYENLEHIKKGMNLVSSEGTARKIFENFPINTGSKTGTAQKSGINPDTGDTYDEFSWFVGFGPYEDPEIAVAAVIFQGGSGGHAGPMVRDVIGEYLGLNNKGIKEDMPFDRVLSK